MGAGLDHTAGPDLVPDPNLEDLDAVPNPHLELSPDHTRGRDNVTAAGA